LNHLRALIFDFDGVLLESNDLKTRGFSTVFARFPEHHDAMMAFHEANVSASRYDKFRHLVVERLHRSAEDPLIDELAASFSGEMRQMLSSCPWVAGAEDFLRRMSGRLPLYLASMTPQEELEDVLAERRLAGVFDAVYGCPPWSKAAALAAITATTGPGDVVFIGDSAGDQRASRAAGIEFIARDSGLPFDDPLPATFPDMNAVAAALEGRLP
jgi:phosphoglycolate phosphatase-like HAD superfamily hydrolase